MYKIYINETPLYLTTVQEAQELGPASDKILVLHYPGKKKFLLNVTDQLEKSDRFERVVVFSKNLEKLWSDFQSAFKLIGAAGGAVFNDGKVLMIFRREHWDLPKGKIDDGETPEQAAIREVEEETGLRQLELGPHLIDTWHTYEMNGVRILKTTYWYLMKTSQTTLTPQHEEDIKTAEWTDLDVFLEKPGKVYGNILDVLNKAKTLKING
jgi:8-oxo-dGTP pyrophosphatase MutT (NUDIX family)